MFAAPIMAPRKRAKVAVRAVSGSAGHPLCERYVPTKRTDL